MLPMTVGQLEKIVAVHIVAQQESNFRFGRAVPLQVSRTVSGSDLPRLGLDGRPVMLQERR